MEPMKVCKTCAKMLPLTSYHKKRGGKYGLQPQCKECSIAYQVAYRVKNADRIRLMGREYLAANREEIAHRKRERKFGVSRVFIQALEAHQNDACAICLKSFEETRSTVDHDHDAGQVRGLLCDNCNLGLGHFSDDPDLLRSAIRYLASPPVATLDIQEATSA